MIGVGYPVKRMVQHPAWLNAVRLDDLTFRSIDIDQ